MEDIFFLIFFFPPALVSGKKNVPEFNWKYNFQDFEIFCVFIMRGASCSKFFLCENFEHVNPPFSGKTALTLHPELSEVCGVELS